MINEKSLNSKSQFVHNDLKTFPSYSIRLSMDDNFSDENGVQSVLMMSS